MEQIKMLKVRRPISMVSLMIIRVTVESSQVPTILKMVTNMVSKAPLIIKRKGIKLDH